ncbi:MAG TPA: Arm DNA-binding domain-containing protein [Candidatus Eremiobacteraceae bacterium]|nr:Arm DNA-binding domain-containing protein [Candidatus Eremiobacteraceae bacterium]
MRGSIFKRRYKGGSIGYGIIYDDHPEPGQKRKQVRLRGFKTRKEADNKLTEIRASFQKTGRYYVPTKLTVAEYIEKWLAQISHSVRERTATGYRERLRDYLLPTLVKLPMWAVEPQHMNDLYSALLCDGRKRKPKDKDSVGLQPRSVLHVHRIAHAMFAEAVRSSVIAVNPCTNVRPPRVPLKPKATHSFRCCSPRLLPAHEWAS